MFLFAVVKNPFTVDVQCIDDDNDKAQCELIQLQEDTSAKLLFAELTVPDFWAKILGKSYPELTKIIMKYLLPFASTYRCEAGFSAMLQIKSKYRSVINVEPDLRCALSVTQPRIKSLISKKQLHPSH